MWPTLLRIPLPFTDASIPIHSYGLMIATGFLLALYLVQRDARKQGIDPKIFGDMAFWTLILGIAGTRILHIIMYPQYYSWNDPLGWIAVWGGGLVFQGAIIPAGLYVWWHLRRHGVPLFKGLDIIIPYVALAHGIGRLGCFLNGCCYGRPADVAWAVRFRRVPWDVNEPPTGSLPYLDHLQRFADMKVTDHFSHAVHPTQLYSFLGLIAICGVLLALRKYWHPFTGFTLPVYLVLYGIFRFIVEFYRGDHNPVHFANLTDQQVFSLLSAAAGAILFAILYQRQRKAAVSQPA